MYYFRNDARRIVKNKKKTPSVHQHEHVSNFAPVIYSIMLHRHFNGSNLWEELLNAAVDAIKNCKGR